MYIPDQRCSETQNLETSQPHFWYLVTVGENPHDPDDESGQEYGVGQERNDAPEVESSVADKARKLEKLQRRYTQSV